MINLEQAKLDPTSVFRKPDDVLADDQLTREEKIAILKRWEYDARELEVADEENMLSNDEDVLYAILKALHKLDAKIDVEHGGGASKHGGKEED